MGISVRDPKDLPMSPMGILPVESGTSTAKMAVRLMGKPNGPLAGMPVLRTRQMQ